VKTRPLELTPLERRQRDHVALPLGSEQEIIDAFHRLQYDSARKNLTWHATIFRGFPIYKVPQDLWTYIELLGEIRPRTIIETGTADGGSAYFFASLLDMYGVKGYRVVTIDIQPFSLPKPVHPNIWYVPSFSSVDWPPKQGRVAGGQQITIPPHLEPPVLVVLDSDHAKDHVLRELDIYGPLVSPGSYLVVEDSNVNGHPVLNEHGPGPHEALTEWLPQHPEFKEDRARAQKQLFSFHTWVKKLSNTT
jgi:cephalosporin hydroxylase